MRVALRVGNQTRVVVSGWSSESSCSSPKGLSVVTFRDPSARVSDNNNQAGRDLWG